MSGIFISYRRADTDVAAGRLAVDLLSEFGPGLIFRDVDQLYPGVDYEVAIDSAINSCAVLLAIIGPQWSTIVDDQGRRRLEDPHDWVRAEIGRALARKVRVIPVLISGTQMPRQRELPAELAPLLKRQACDLEDRHWKEDLDVLVRAIENIPGVPKRLATHGLTSTRGGQLKLIGSKQRFPLFKPLMTIYVNNNEVGRMRLSDDFTFDVEPGTHSVFIKNVLGVGNSNTATFDVEAGQRRAFAVSSTWGGQIKVAEAGLYGQ